MGRTADNRHSDWVMNVGQLDIWAGNHPFIDLARQYDQSFNYTTTLGTKSLADAITDGLVDATGNIISPQPETEKITAYNTPFFSLTSSTLATGDRSYWNGRKVEIRWDGTATMDLLNRSSWTVTDGNDQAISLPYTATDGVVRATHSGDWTTETILWTSISATDPVRNVKALIHEHIGVYDTGTRVNPDYKELFKHFGIARCMDPQGTNGSTVVNYSQMKPDGYINIASDYYNDRLPLGDIATFCNEMGMDLWYCVPHQATDAAIASILSKLDTDLDNDLVLYLEYSNELWNGGFPQSSYAAAQDALDVVPGGTPYAGWTKDAARYNGFRTCQIKKIADDNIASRDVRMILGGWTVSSGSGGHTDKVIEGVQFYIDNVDGTKTISDLAYGYGITDYFCGGQPLNNNDVLGVSNTQPPSVILGDTHSFSNGDIVYIAGGTSLTAVKNPMVELWDTTDGNYAGPYFKVANQTTRGFELQDLAGNDVDASGWGAWPGAETIASGNVQATSGDNTITVTNFDIDASVFNLIGNLTGFNILFLTTHSFAGITINAGDYYEITSFSGSSPNYTITFEHPSTPSSTANSTVGMDHCMHWNSVAAVDAEIYQKADEGLARFNAGLDAGRWDYTNKLIYDHTMDIRYIDGWNSGDSTFSWLKTKFQEHFDKVNANGVKLVQYEGGSHLYPQDAINGDGGEPVSLEMFTEFNYSWECAKISGALEQEFRAVGGVMSCKFTNMLKSSNFGSWGLYRSLSDSTPISEQWQQMIKPKVGIQGVKFKIDGI